MNYKKILIAIDDKPKAEYVAQQGLQLGKQLNAKIAVVSVADAPSMTEGNITPDEMAEMVKSDFKKNQTKIIDKLFKGQVESFLKEGTPDEMILQVAEDWQADLIVIGKHSGEDINRILAGSISKKVSGNADIPVLIVPPKK